LGSEVLRLPKRLENIMQSSYWSAWHLPVFWALLQGNMGSSSSIQRPEAISFGGRRLSFVLGASTLRTISNTKRLY